MTATEQAKETPKGLTLTARQLLESSESFIRLLNEKPLGKPQLAYNLTRTFRDFRTEIEELSKQRLAIIKAHGGEEKDGQVTLSRDKLTPEFQTEMEEFLAIPVTLWGHRITINELEAAQINLSAAEMLVLDWLICE